MAQPVLPGSRVKVYASPLFHLLSGAVIIGAFFIATDPVTAATTELRPHRLLRDDDRRPVDLRDPRLGRLSRTGVAFAVSTGQHVRALYRLLHPATSLRRKMIAICNRRQILISGVFLWLFAVAGTSLVALTEVSTRDAIIENERQVLLRNLYALLAGEQAGQRHRQRYQLEIAAIGPARHRLAYIAGLSGAPATANPWRQFSTAIAPNGYNGRIHLLVGVYVDGSIAGVRVVKHAETPVSATRWKSASRRGSGAFRRQVPVDNPDCERWAGQSATAANSTSSPAPLSRRARWSAAVTPTTPAVLSAKR